MGVLDDVRNWLKEIPLWRELETIPRRMEELEARVRALEKALERVAGVEPVDVTLAEIEAMPLDKIGKIAVRSLPDVEVLHLSKPDGKQTTRMNFRDGAFFEKVKLDDGKLIGFSHDKVRFEREGDSIYVTPEKPK